VHPGPIVFLPCVWEGSCWCWKIDPHLFGGAANRAPHSGDDADGPRGDGAYVREHGLQVCTM
jgi:hypothetical protein